MTILVESSYLLVQEPSCLDNYHLRWIPNNGSFEDGNVWQTLSQKTDTEWEQFFLEIGVFGPEKLQYSQSVCMLTSIKHAIAEGDFRVKMYFVQLNK